MLALTCLNFTKQ